MTARRRLMLRAGVLALGVTLCSCRDQAQIPEQMGPAAGLPGHLRVYYEREPARVYELVGQQLVVTGAPYRPRAWRWYSERMLSKSSDGMRTVQASNPAGVQTLVMHRYSIVDNTGAALVDVDLRPGFIGDMVWSPTGRWLAVLEAYERWGKGPLELLFAAAGHPVPYDRLYLTVRDGQGALVLRLAVGDEETYGVGHLEWVE